jgi:toxin ParE1/3/4
MTYSVIMLPEAREDLIEIFRYVAEHDSVIKADALLNRLEEKCNSLCTAPERGHQVNELKRIHVEGFREIHFKPYRIVFQVFDARVFVHAILDGRRDLQEFLERRILS